jgi:hypothetical protein
MIGKNGCAGVTFLLRAGVRDVTVTLEGVPWYQGRRANVDPQGPMRRLKVSGSLQLASASSTVMV